MGKWLFLDVPFNDFVLHALVLPLIDLDPYSNWLVVLLPLHIYSGPLILIHHDISEKRKKIP